MCACLCVCAKKDIKRGFKKVQKKDDSVTGTEKQNIGNANGHELNQVGSRQAHTKHTVLSHTLLHIITFAMQITETTEYFTLSAP